MCHLNDNKLLFQLCGCEYDSHSMSYVFVPHPWRSWREKRNLFRSNLDLNIIFLSETCRMKQDFCRIQVSVNAGFSTVYCHGNLCCGGSTLEISRYEITTYSPISSVESLALEDPLDLWEQIVRCVTTGSKTVTNNRRWHNWSSEKQKTKTKQTFSLKWTKTCGITRVSKSCELYHNRSCWYGCMWHMKCRVIFSHYTGERWARVFPISDDWATPTGHVQQWVWPRGCYRSSIVIDNI